MSNGAKFATIVACVVGLMALMFTSFAWATAQAVDYGSVKATVSAHTETLKRIETKLDSLRSGQPLPSAAAAAVTP